MLTMAYGLDIRPDTVIEVEGVRYPVRSVRPSPVYADTVQVYTDGPLFPGETVAPLDPMASLSILYVSAYAVVVVR